MEKINKSNGIHLNGNGNGKAAAGKTEFLPNSKKVYIYGKINKDVKVPLREIKLNSTRQPDGSIQKNESLLVYDTSGYWGDENVECNVKEGLPAIRLKWIKDRNDVEEYTGRNINPMDNGYKSEEELEKARNSNNGKLEHFPGLRRKPLKAKTGEAVTQFAYARKEIITPEMEYIAIRENLGREKAVEYLLTDNKKRDLLNWQHKGESF